MLMHVSKCTLLPEKVDILPLPPPPPPTVPFAEFSYILSTDLGAGVLSPLLSVLPLLPAGGQVSPNERLCDQSNLKDE